MSRAPVRPARYAAAAVLLGLYALGSAWLVRSEGRRYRAELRGKQPATQPVAAAARETRTALSPEAAPPPPAPVRAAVSPEIAQIAAADKRSPQPPAPPPRAAAHPASLPAAAAAPTGASAEPITALASHDPYWDAPDKKELWDLADLTPPDEIRLGRALHEVVLHFNKPLTSGEWLARVEEAAEPLLATVSRPGISYTFTVLDSDAVNAFAFPGGYVYVTRGLLELLGEDEDYALQFAIGHEMAHVELQHAIHCLLDPEVKKLGIGTLPQFYLLVIPWGYLEAQDYEADRWIFERMTRLGRTRYESLAFLRKFEQYARRRGFGNGREKPNPSSTPSIVENHYPTHPSVKNRLRQLTRESQAGASPARESR